jgi:hypothetical protein
MVMKNFTSASRCALASTLLSLMCTGHADAANREVSASVLFQTSDRCVACHNGMSTTQGREVSIGTDWSTSLMANSARDPYWQASVRRETVDHPESRHKIENECSTCHMPIPYYEAKLAGQLGTVFAHLPLNEAHSKEASDGVTCSVCHQITTHNLGTPESYNGNFTIGQAAIDGSHAEYGPYDISDGLQRVMRTSTGGLQPQLGDQMRSPELCASCHTLITEARGENGAVVGNLPEQMPYQEWLHSDLKNQRTCQSCHMPAVDADVPITRILGANRSGVARHQFVGANFLMQRLLGRYHDELDVGATPQDLAEAADRTIRFLQAESAAVSLAPPQLLNGRLQEDVTVRNLGGHKLPTAYPSRRAWLHVTVRDGNNRTIFESGALNDDGSIAGNDNDADPTRYEPHYTEIRSADQVQIYESILQDTKGAVTTGLLAAVGYVKDNRLLPRGFHKQDVPAEIAVHGSALQDPRFDDEGHRIRYSVEVGHATGPFAIEAELWYQPIGFRWASNLKPYPADEPQRFSAYFNSMSRGSGIVLAKATVTAP